MTKTAFIAIVGKPNVGKSSILNKILGQKIAIVSSKPQTTRTKIMGVLTEDETQLVFTDTPGFHIAHNKLGEKMNATVGDTVGGMDACLFIVEPKGKLNEQELQLIEMFKKQKCPVILAINKIDTVADKKELLERIVEINSMFDFTAVVPVSATEGDHVDELVDELKLMDKEIPHGIAVAVEKMRERDDKDILDIEATIYCERESHKGMVIGKNGAMLKKVSTYARQDLESFFRIKVNLHCWVKVKLDWRNREGLIHNFGLD